MSLRLHSDFERSFDVLVSPGSFEALRLEDLGIRRVLVVTTPTVDRLHGARLRAWLETRDVAFGYVVTPLTEQRKDLKSVEDVAAEVIRHDLGRRDAIVAFGGGVCSDVVAFTASMVRRGIPHVRIPTTLLGQIDAGIGIKGGVNFRNHKNFLGCFHPPSGVLVNPRLLTTLTRQQILQGLAEIVKIALVADAQLFATLERHGSAFVASRFQEPAVVANAVIERAIELMLRELQQNPFEDRSLQRSVDMGHTFSPVLEAESGFTLSHGEAVAIDMALTCVLALDAGIMVQRDAGRVVGLLSTLGLPIWSTLLTPALCMVAVERAMKHRGGRLNLVTAPQIGTVDFVQCDALDDSAFGRCIERLRASTLEAEPARAEFAFAG